MKNLSAILAFALCCYAVGIAGERVEFPPLVEAQPRTLDLKALNAWYEGRIDPITDAELAKSVQRAEALVANLLRMDASKHAPMKQELFALKLPPKTLRAVIRHGQIPAREDAPKGEFAAAVPIPGFKDKSVALTLLVPEAYTAEKRWPVIVSLHGQNGKGADYIRHWQHGSGAAQIKNYIVVAPTAAEGYGWGPATFGRAQVAAALDFVAAYYRIDPDRIYMEGTSMGGVGTKRLAAFWPDRFGAIVTRAGPPIPPQQAAVLRNLHALPWLSLAGAQDKLIAEKHFIAERDLATKEKIPATMEIFAGRGHESFQDKDADALALFAGHTRQHAPERLRFVSFEDGGGQRHYYAEITGTDTSANPQSDEIVLNNARTDDALLKEMRSTTSLAQYEALLKQAKEKGVVVETKKIWSKGRELELHFDRAANAIVIDRIALIKQLRLYVDEELLDMDKEIVVKLQDRVITRKKVERSVSFMLDEMLGTKRRDMTYWGALDVRL